MNSFGARICLTSLQSCKGFQSLIPFMSKTPPSPFYQTKTWCGHLGYAMEGKIKWTFNLIMFHMLASHNSWKVNKGIWAPLCNGMFTKTFRAKWMSHNHQKPPWAYVVNIYGINFFNFFNSYTKHVIIHVLNVFWYKYQCRYGLEDYWEDSTHTQSIKQGCFNIILNQTSIQMVQCD